MCFKTGLMPRARNVAAIHSAIFEIPQKLTHLSVCHARITNSLTKLTFSSKALGAVLPLSGLYVQYE